MSIAPAFRDNNDRLLSFGLSANTRQYEYRGIDDFLSVLSCEGKLFEEDNSGTRSQYLVFHDISERTFKQDFVDSIKSGVTFESYFPRRRIILVKMESKPHAVASRLFGTTINMQLEHMNGLHKKIMQVGSAHVKTVDRTKRADDSFQPIHLPKGRGRKWPTLGIEVGYSQSLRKLKEDAKWWIKESKGDVRNVITISINRSYKEITFEKWSSTPSPVATSRVVVSQEAGQQQIRMTNANPLVIPFQDLFLRVPGPGETDVIIDSEDIKEFAMKVWIAQDWEKDT